MTIHNTELASQHRAYTDIRKRLWGAPAKNTGAAGPKEEDPIVTEMRRTIEKLEREVKSLRRSLKHSTANDERVKNLELALADAHARILAQAEMISAHEREKSDLDEDGEVGIPPVFQRRTVPEIVAEVLKNYPRVTWEDVKGIRRTRELIAPRQACMKAVYDERKDLSLPRIGKLFNRDHTTVLHAVRKIEAMRGGA